MRIRDAIVIGRGPAGLQAAIHLARAGLSVAVVGYGHGSLSKAALISNYFGIATPVSGADLLLTGERQAVECGAEIVGELAVGVDYASADESGFAVITPSKRLLAKTLIIATGANRTPAPIAGIADFDGKGVSYCATCDGFFYAGKRVGVLGHSEYAIHEAETLARAGASLVTVFTNGEETVGGACAGTTQDDIAGANPTATAGANPTATADAKPTATAGAAQAPTSDMPPSGCHSGIKLTSARISGVLSESGKFAGFVMEDGGEARLDGLFVAWGIAGSGELAMQLGAETRSDGSVVADSLQATSVPGVFVAGDCTGSFMQVAVAVGQGALAARSAIEYCAAALTPSRQ